MGGIVILATAIYGRLLGSDFVFWDDPSLIIDNPAVHGFTFKNIASAFSTYDPDLYVPLTTLSYQLNYALGGLSPFLYHLTNVVLHAANAVLTGWVTLLLFRRKSVAVITALLFLVHPINVEAVVWISARKDLLSAFFFLLALGSYLQWKNSVKRSWYGTSLASFLLGLLSKVSVIFLPVILLLTDWRHKRPFTRATLISLAPFFLLSVIFGIVAVAGKLESTRPLWMKLLLGMQATLFSLWHLVWPMNYSVIYPYTQTPSLADPILLLSLLGVLAISVGTLFLRKRFPSITLGWWFFLLMLAPSFLTVEKGTDVIRDLYLTSDRYVYVAGIGIFWIVALVLEQLRVRNARASHLLVTLIIAVLSVLAFMQTLVWQNSETLFLSALARSPDSSAMHNNLGVYYESTGRSQEAADQYLAAVKTGGTGDAWFNVGVLAMNQNRTPEAIEAFTRAVTMQPTMAVAHLNLGAQLLNAGRLQEAVDHLLAAQKLDPGNVIIYMNLGIALEKGENTIDAIRAYERALQLDPGNAFALERIGKLKK